MSLAEASIVLGGILSLGMAFVHWRFPAMFRWDSDLTGVSASNRRIVHTIHLALLVCFLLFGLLSLVYFRELASAHGLGFGVCLIFAALWLWRGVWQLIYFRAATRRHLRLHVAFAAAFFLLFASYGLPLVISLME